MIAGTPAAPNSSARAAQTDKDFDGQRTAIRTCCAVTAPICCSPFCHVEESVGIYCPCSETFPQELLRSIRSCVRHQRGLSKSFFGARTIPVERPNAGSPLALGRARALAAPEARPSITSGGCVERGRSYPRRRDRRTFSCWASQCGLKSSRTRARSKLTGLSHTICSKVAVSSGTKPGAGPAMS